MTDAEIVKVVNKLVGGIEPIADSRVRSQGLCLREDYSK